MATWCDLLRYPTRTCGALRVTAIPAAVALIQQQVLPIPTLPPEEASLRLMINRILEVAEQQGMTISRSGSCRDSERFRGRRVTRSGRARRGRGIPCYGTGRLATAANAYRKLLGRKPNDQMAGQALAQCELMVRISATDPKRRRSKMRIGLPEILTSPSWQVMCR